MSEITQMIIKGESVTMQLKDGELSIREPDRPAFTPRNVNRKERLIAIYQNKDGYPFEVESVERLCALIQNLDPHNNILSICDPEKLALLATGIHFQFLYRLASPYIYPFLTDEYGIQSDAQDVSIYDNILSWIICIRVSLPRHVVRLSLNTKDYTLSETELQPCSL